jgi:hypothetical protein
MIDSVQLGTVIGPFSLIIGLSVLLYPKVWMKVFDHFSKDHLSFLGLMFLSLLLGLFLVRVHNVWEMNVYVIITLIGWGALLKGAIYFLLPGDMIKSMMKMFKSEGLYVFGGLVWTVAGAALTYQSFWA